MAEFGLRGFQNNLWGRGEVKEGYFSKQNGLICPLDPHEQTLPRSQWAGAGVPVPHTDGDDSASGAARESGLLEYLMRNIGVMPQSRLTAAVQRSRARVSFCQAPDI